MIFYELFERPLKENEKSLQLSIIFSLIVVLDSPSSAGVFYGFLRKAAFISCDLGNAKTRQHQFWIIEL